MHGPESVPSAAPAQSDTSANDVQGIHAVRWVGEVTLATSYFRLVGIRINLEGSNDPS